MPSLTRRICITLTAPRHQIMQTIIPLLWRGGRLMHFIMSAFSNHAVVLHNVTPIDLPAQSAVLSDGVVAACLYKYGARPFPSSGGVAGLCIL